MRIYVFLSALILLLPFNAHAQVDDGLKLPPPGTTILNLSATETEKVPQDMIVASLRMDVDEEDATAVQSKINLAMQTALARAKKDTTVKTTTGSYSVYPYDPNPNPAPQPLKNQKPVQRWRGSQTIDLQSLDSETLLKLTGDLQQMGFVMNNLGYTLSPEKYESVQDGLLVNALAKLKNKADLASKTLKKSGYDMLNIDLNPSGQIVPMYAPRAMMMNAAMDKSMAAPVAQAGESDVSLTVSARVLLKP